MWNKIKWLGVVLLILVLLLFGLQRLMNSRTYQLFGDLTNRVETKEKLVALTFDDGPTENVEQLLPILSEFKAKATFFVIGDELKSNMEQGRRIVEAGHQLGNHSYTHTRMIFSSHSFVKQEIEQTNALIWQAGYTGEIVFRPPYGKKLYSLPRYLSERGIKSITWNIEPDTNYTSAADKVKAVTETVTPGAIILLHPMYDKTGKELQAAKEIVEQLTKEGYRFVTVNELLAAAEK